jgi:hypothetical protein
MVKRSHRTLKRGIDRHLHLACLDRDRRLVWLGRLWR